MAGDSNKAYVKTQNGKRKFLIILKTVEIPTPNKFLTDVNHMPHR
jgi:hypothetical protein